MTPALEAEYRSGLETALKIGWSILEKGGSPWPQAFRRAIGVLIKDEEDLSAIAPELGRIVEEALG